jgi:hypothetical protein
MEVSDRARTSGPEGAQVRNEGSDIEQWRQEHEQDQLGFELDLGHARDEPEDQPAEDQHDRVWDGDAARQSVEGGHRHQTRRDEELDALHIGESDASKPRWDRPVVRRVQLEPGGTPLPVRGAVVRVLRVESSMPASVAPRSYQP